MKIPNIYIVFYSYNLHLGKFIKRFRVSLFILRSPGGAAQAQLQNLKQSCRCSVSVVKNMNS